MEFTCNAKATNALLFGLSELELVKVIACTTAKSIWDKMNKCYEGDNKVKQAKLQGFRMKFESLKMHGDEDIWNKFLTVDEVEQYKRPWWEIRRTYSGSEGVEIPPREI